MNKLHRRATLGLCIAATLLASACGSNSTSKTSSESTSKSSSESTGASSSKYIACMVTDTGGINDTGFNQAAWAGMQAAQSDGKATVSYLPSTTASDYSKNIAALEAKHCDLIVTVGQLMADATTAAAKADPSQHFAIVDNAGNGSNMQGLLFNTAQSGFLAGYLAAGYSKSGKVAVYGGMNFPAVTVQMDGFWEGVQYYNSQHSAQVQVLGWNEPSQNGTFAGSFTDQTKGSQIANNFIQAGADVIMQVAGGTGLGTAQAVQAAGGKAALIWVDTDGCVAQKQYCSSFLSTIEKGVATAVKTAAESGSDGSYSTKDYVGTLDNGGVALAPYHDFASKVPQALQSEITQVTKDIESGKINLTSKNQP